jgi:hypothetical protein
MKNKKNIPPQWKIKFLKRQLEFMENEHKNPGCKLTSEQKTFYKNCLIDIIEDYSNGTYPKNNTPLF